MTSILARQEASDTPRSRYVPPFARPTAKFSAPLRIPTSSSAFLRPPPSVLYKPFRSKYPPYHQVETPAIRHSSLPLKPGSRNPRLYSQTERSSFKEYLHQGLGESLGRIDPSKIRVRENAVFEDVQYAGSYKWVEGDRPTIAIPGIPDRWVANSKIGKIPPDRELAGLEEYPDYNANQVPTGVSPLEPTFLALTSPDLLMGIDIVTSRNNLLKLFSHLLNPAQPEPFRINVTTVPGTKLVLLHRWEPPSKTSARQPQSWHLSYHENITRKIQVGSDRTPGCHRLVKYRFGGLGILVKFDVDAYQPGEQEELEEALSKLGIQTDNVTPNPLTGDIVKKISTGISIQHEDHPPPSQSSLTSIKTRTYIPNQPLHTLHQFHKIYAALLFAQVPTLHLGFHSAGDFSAAPSRTFKMDGPDMIEVGEDGAVGEKVAQGMTEQYRHTTNLVGGVLRGICLAARRFGEIGVLGLEGGRIGIHRVLNGQGREKLSEEVLEMVWGVCGAQNT